jgi:peptidoglycan/xylan/chitin deacetylase (PgdA/CDA1 family)
MTSPLLKSIAKRAVRLNIDRVANLCFEKALRPRFQIIGYHKVSPDPHPFFEPVEPAVFEQQMQFLKDSYNVVELQELVARSQQGQLPERAVAITFDDGYRDNYEYAFPILKKYGLPATIFVATAAINNAKTLWHDRIFDAFRFATKRPEATEEMTSQLSRAIDRARQLWGNALWEFVEKLEAALEPDFTNRPSGSMLTWEQIRAMHGSGVQFGSHTVNHPILSRLPKDEIELEVRQSQAELSSELGTTITSFAYPNGRVSDYNDEVKSALKRCGYTCAVTARPGFNTGSTDPLELRRQRPWQKEIELFRLSFMLQRHGLAS